MSIAFEMGNDLPEKRWDMQIGVEMSKALENKRVFIVDDNEIIRAALQFMLHDEFEAHEVASAAIAFEKAKTQPPDLLFLAESLVKSEGVELLQKIRTEMPQAKILVVVEAGANAFGKECVSAGAHGFLAKPLKIEFVRQKADAMLGRSTGGVTIPLTVLNVR
ncbi:response regulator [Methylocystis echinoides]|uniref:response regulator n=1 Tax=Methylocystis echinoides TaxID=29468 RepID=UPI00341B502E